MGVGEGKIGLAAAVSMLCAAVGVAQDDGEPFGERLARAAAAQVGVTVVYDPEYRVLDYPGGDVPKERGVCTDVVIRAYRALGIDLQRLVHEDMRRDFAAYPRLWGLARPDPNIDHRRVPNLRIWFARHGESLPVSGAAGDYRAGDLVTWRLPSGRPHVGVVALERVGDRPLVVHHLSARAEQDDVLFAFPITGHYRYPPDSPPAATRR